VEKGLVGCAMLVVSVACGRDQDGLHLRVGPSPRLALPARHQQWNKIEHRLFCHITKNWRGRPLYTFETIVELIGHTLATAGLRVKAKLDKRSYATGQVVTKAEMRTLARVPDASKVIGTMNYGLGQVDNSISIKCLSSAQVWYSVKFHQGFGVARDDVEKDPQGDLLEARVSQLEQTLVEIKKKPKDAWDKISALGALVSGILVAVIGGLFTLAYSVVNEQRDAKTKAEQARIQELQAVAQLMPYLTSQDQNTQKYAITAVQVLANVRIATELAKLNPTSGTVAGLAAIAAQGSTIADRLVADSTLRQVCGVADLELKTLEDPENRQVQLQPEKATIEELARLERPAEASDRMASRLKPNRSRAEKKTYSVEADLLGVKKESSSDYSLVLGSESGLTMRAVVPDPACAGVSAFRDRFGTVRELIEQYLGKPGSSYDRTKTRVEVQGVGFFNRVHGQIGVAANGFELHPVLNLNFTGPASPIQRSGVKQ
jgi:hypothetical protein